MCGALGYAHPGMRCASCGTELSPDLAFCDGCGARVGGGGSVTLSVCRRLELPSAPYLVSLVLASNIGGMSTLIGDPPNIMIGSATGLTFNDFALALTPVIAASLSHLVLGEKVHAYTWSATILALCGAALITSQGIDSGHWVGDALAMTSAFCSATILTIIRATGRKVATSLALGSRTEQAQQRRRFRRAQRGVRDQQSRRPPGCHELAR